MRTNDENELFIKTIRHFANRKLYAASIFTSQRQPVKKMTQEKLFGQKAFESNMNKIGYNYCVVCPFPQRLSNVIGFKYGTEHLAHVHLAHWLHQHICSVFSLICLQFIRIIFWKLWKMSVNDKRYDSYVAWCVFESILMWARSMAFLFWTVVMCFTEYQYSFCDICEYVHWQNHDCNTCKCVDSTQ